MIAGKGFFMVTEGSSCILETGNTSHQIAEQGGLVTSLFSCVMLSLYGYISRSRPGGISGSWDKVHVSGSILSPYLSEIWHATASFLHPAQPAGFRDEETEGHGPKGPCCGVLPDLLACSGWLKYAQCWRGLLFWWLTLNVTGCRIVWFLSLMDRVCGWGYHSVSNSEEKKKRLCIQLWIN